MAKQTKTTKSTSNTKGKKTPPSQLKEEFREIAGVNSRKDYIRLISAAILLVVGLFLLLSMVSNIFTGAADQSGVMAGQLKQAHNFGGVLGAYSSYYLMNNYFGLLSILFPVFLLAIVMKLMVNESFPIRLWLLFLHFFIITVLGSIDAHYIQETFLPDSIKGDLAFQLGGLHGKSICTTLANYIGQTVAGIILFILTILYIGYWFTQVFIWIFKAFHKLNQLLFGRFVKTEDEEDDESEAEDDEDEEVEEETKDDASLMETDTPNEYSPQVQDFELELEEETESEVLNNSSKDALVNILQDSNEEFEPAFEDESLDLEISEGTIEAKSSAKTAADVAALPPYDPKLDLSRYQYPPISLLEKHDSGNIVVDMEEQEANKQRIIKVLGNFDVKISAISATVGPTVTLYEITPAPGIRIAKIRNLEDDIALSLSAIGIRIIAPIPGKGTIGIEVPNRNPQVVSMESIINTQKFKETKFELPIAFGKTITNEIFMVDLAKMPHLLVAGATGQGKSVGLNALITSLLYKKHPAELKLVMIDPKKVEFSMYNPLIKHFLAQVPDSDEPVITDVKKVIQTLKSLCQEMDDRYDLLKKARCKNIKEYNAKFTSRQLNPENGHHFLPYIVVIIDEYGDLIMTAGKDIELPIARIAQLARAVGMHMVIATQSPRTTIITGKIKANFPGRVAFKVSGRTESMTILDRTGANNLIGRGDMLFLAGSDITRVQCAFVDTPEVEAITDYISQQQAYPVPYELPLVAEEGSDGSDSMPSGDGSTFEQVARFVVNTQQGSTSKIQRTFSIGFNRAGRLMDQLEEAGIVGPVNGSKPREVYVQSEIELQQVLDQLRAQGKIFE